MRRTKAARRSAWSFAPRRRAPKTREDDAHGYEDEGRHGLSRHRVVRVRVQRQHRVRRREGRQGAAHPTAALRRRRRAWRSAGPGSIEARGKVFEPGDKTLLPPLVPQLQEAHLFQEPRAASDEARRLGPAAASATRSNRGESKYDQHHAGTRPRTLIAAEIKRVHDELRPAWPSCARPTVTARPRSSTLRTAAQAMTCWTCAAATRCRRASPTAGRAGTGAAKHMWGMEPGRHAGEPARTCSRTSAEHGDAVLYWGCDLETTPWGWGGQQPSRMAYFLEELGLALVLHIARPQLHGRLPQGQVDPRAAQHRRGACSWPSPTSWITEGTYYKDYVDTHTIGFDWFERLRAGQRGRHSQDPPMGRREVRGSQLHHQGVRALLGQARRVHRPRRRRRHDPLAFLCTSPPVLEIVLLAMQGLGRHGAGQLHLIEFGQFGFAEWNPMPRSQKYFERARAPTMAGWRPSDARTSFPRRSRRRRSRCRKARSLRGTGTCVCTAPRDDQFLPFEFPRGRRACASTWSCPTRPAGPRAGTGAYAMQEALATASAWKPS